MRVASLKDLLRKTDADAYLVTDVKNVYYFTSFRDISEAALNLLITLKDDPVLLVSPLSFVAAKENARSCVVMEIHSGERMLDRLTDVIRDMKVREVHFDNLSAQTYLELIKKLEVKFIPDPDLIWALRRVKDEDEIAYIKKAANLAVIGVEAGVEAVKPGIKEYEVAAEVEYAMRTKGSEGMSFETIVASGPRSAYPHGLCSDRVINSGDLVMIDLGAIHAGYCSDITRTVVAGKPSPRQQNILNLVLRAQQETFKNFCAGVKARDVDASARKILADDNCEKYFIHGLGHGVGLSIHEPPLLSPSSEVILEEGNVVTNEPGVYIEGFGGVRIEDMILVRKNRGEKLTNAPYHI
ncbi:MAG: Xaa-Pro peptidase family protein [Candidatus Bathyarchaeota archaeon]